MHCDYLHDSLVSDVISKYDDFSKEYFENKDRNIKQYSAYVKKIDSYLNTIFKDIHKENIDDSIILIFSDHGCSIGERPGEKVYGGMLIGEHKKGQDKSAWQFCANQVEKCGHSQKKYLNPYF